ncbi:hypothetical protein LCGC14_2451120 [marine sediment metagenome]|uniref:Uncharacterized protein n=1 Tax=marine sediment metagenome TaxID=412755 RepID=A0A0F9C3R5_9ZZZZ
METTEVQVSTTVDLSKEQIEEVFRAAEANERPHQALYVVGLHEAVVPDWDRVERLLGYPRCNPLTWEFIMDLAKAFDCRHHSDVMAGGCWMNRGFSTCGDDLPEWCVEMPEIRYREGDESTQD